MSFPRRIPGFALCFCCAAVSPYAVSAEEPSWPQMRQALSEGAEHAQYWQYGWGAFHGTVTALNAYQASEADDAEDRFDARVTALTSALGLVDLLIHPLPHQDAYERVEQLYAEGPDNPRSVQAAREYFRAVAQEEVKRRHWRQATGAFFVNLAAGLTIALGDDRPGDGAMTFASGMLVMGLKLWTLPDEVSESAGRYQTARFRLGSGSLEVEYAVVPAVNGVGVVLRY